jgi:uncharacterized protein YprB with RNaseH-like and TPR domain
MHPLLKNILVLDIETVAAHPTYDVQSAEMQEHWNRKSSFLRNEDEKPSEQMYEDRAAIYAEFGKIIVIGMGIFYKEDEAYKFKVKSLANSDEKQLLLDFVDVIRKFDQDNLKLCGHNGKEFDFPYLCRRLIVNQIEIPWALDLGGKKPWEVNHIDTMELWKFGDRKNFTSLKLLTDLLQIPSSKTDLDGSKVNETYYKEKDGLKKIATYCRGDVLATAQLYLRLNNLPLIEPQNITNSNE